MFRKNLKTNTYFSFLLPFFFFSCSSQNDAIIVGKVVTSNGEPVKDAGIHIEYLNLENLITYFQKPEIVLVFELQEKQEVKIDIYRHSSGSTLLNIVDTTLNSGQYVFRTPRNSITNGIYDVDFESKVNQNKSSLLVQADSLEMLLSVDPLATTGLNGSFILDTDILGIGQSISASPERFIIPNGIRFIAIKDSKILGVSEDIFLDLEKENNIDIVIQ